MIWNEYNSGCENITCISSHPSISLCKEFDAILPLSLKNIPFYWNSMINYLFYFHFKLTSLKRQWHIIQFWSSLWATLQNNYFKIISDDFCVLALLPPFSFLMVDISWSLFSYILSMRLDLSIKISLWIVFRYQCNSRPFQWKPSEWMKRNHWKLCHFRCLSWCHWQFSSWLDSAGWRVF